jgi:hypothetical protein
MRAPRARRHRVIDGRVAARGDDERASADVVPAESPRATTSTGTRRRSRYIGTIVGFCGEPWRPMVIA